MEPKTLPCQFEIDMKYDYDAQIWFPGNHLTEDIDWDFGYPDTDDVLILTLKFQKQTFLVHEIVKLDFR